MNQWNILFLLGGCFLQCRAREPFKPREGSLPFLVYYASRYRGICIGTLISRTTVLTAAVCVTNPISVTLDRRPINVITGATYRHPRRGIRVQVTKILIPNSQGISLLACLANRLKYTDKRPRPPDLLLSLFTPSERVVSYSPFPKSLLKEDENNRGYLMEKSAAILLLKRKVPDALGEIPLRALKVDYLGEEKLALQEECVMPGWHFFYKGDKIYPINKFLLQRNVRVQFLNIVKKNLWCDALNIKFQKALSNLGFIGYIDKTAAICLRDPDRTAQPCHGMYGAPLICQGKAVGMLMAPDAQWTNCTGFSNLVHVFSSQYLRKFMTCVSRLFQEDITINWSILKKSMYDDIDDDQYDYVPSLYDRIESISTSEEDI